MDALRLKLPTRKHTYTVYYLYHSTTQSMEELGIKPPPSEPCHEPTLKCIEVTLCSLPHKTLTQNTNSISLPLNLLLY